MPRNILMLFPDEWDLALLERETARGRFQFFTEGFDLFSFPSNAQLFTYQVQKFAERVARKYAGRQIDGVFTSDEQFGPVAAALVGERLGVPVTSLEAVLLAQHKYWSRVRQKELLPEATPAFGTVDRTLLAQGECPLPFPFYIKPIKAAFSVLARRVNSLEDVRQHVTFGWWEDAIIRRLVKPFNDATRAMQVKQFGEYIDAYTMICEGLITGHQVTCNGFAQAGEVTMLGTVDSIMYPGTDQFMRFQYPSRLPPAVLARVNALAVRVAKALGVTHGMFNVELMWNPATDEIRVVELNPRVAGQFFDLFRAVDGYCLFEATLALACGEKPLIRERAGESAHAASFVLRDFSNRGLAYVPSEREIDELRRAHPESHLHVYIKTGNGLTRELKWLGSYRYCVMNIAGATLEDMFAKFVRTRDAIGFHPASYRERYARDSIADLVESHHSLVLR
jgi:hypothetical protein